VAATAADWQSIATDLASALTQSVSADGQTPITGNLQMSNYKLTGLAAGSAVGNSLRWEQLFSQGVETDIPSAGTLDIGVQNTNFLRVTGTTTITSLGTNYNGPRFLRFSDALTLTYDATSLILQGGANIVTEAGDMAIAIPKSTLDGWYVIFQRVNYNTFRNDILAPGFYQNYIDNPIGPSGVVYQRTVAATADDAYFADRWYSLSQTGTVTPSVISAPETGFSQGLRVTQSQASAQRYGFAQILPLDYVSQLVGGNVSLSLRARISNTTTLRWALLGWSGTADAVTSDVVNDWTSATYTTGNFFITGAGSLSVIATGSQAMTANTFATLSTNAAAIGASINNLILFCWTDSTQAQNTTLDWHDARLTKTDVRVPVITRSLSAELDACQPYWMPTEITLGIAITSTAADFVFNYKRQMRVQPTFVTISGGVNLRVNGSTSNIGVTPLAVTVSTLSANIQLTRNTGAWTAGNAVVLAEQGAFAFDANL
jgi:hypothetical protein